jgi:hypothetical protein
MLPVQKRADQVSSPTYYSLTKNTTSYQRVTCFKCNLINENNANVLLGAHDIYVHAPGAHEKGKMNEISHCRN